MAGSTKAQKLPGGVVHELPADLSEGLGGSDEALAAWLDITPLARNEAARTASAPAGRHPRGQATRTKPRM